MTEADLVGRWAIAFAVTALVEVPLATALLAPSGASVSRRVAIALTAQLATHPIVWFVIPALGLSRAPFLVVAESFAALAETVVYRFALDPLGWRRALYASLAANAASLAVGLGMDGAGL